MTEKKSLSEQIGFQLIELEKDEQLGALANSFEKNFIKERGYQDLSEEKKHSVKVVLKKLNQMRFKSKKNFIEVCTLLLENVDPNLGVYVNIVIQNSEKSLPQNTQGVLVIYTGGTIGSAPKDPNDFESPQVVKPWQDLKFAVPNLDRIGFPVDAISFKEPLDSCNVGPSEWRAMANLINKYYENYEGFVILHGTDTMAYTGSALSFMLQRLNKPVVITGSQVAGIINIRTDAHQNFLTALNLANPKHFGLPIVPEVMIVFGKKILRGCRAKKLDAAGYDGFGSPNYHPLGTAGDEIEIDKLRVRSLGESRKLQIREKMNTNVITLDVFPGIQNSTVIERILADKELKGVILRAYGSGNIPTTKRFLDPIKKVTDDTVVVNVTQCSKGTVAMGLYETSQLLLDRGIIGGFDITAEAALCKLMTLLGEYEDINEVKKLMQRSIAGEQSYSLYTTTFEQVGLLEKTNPSFIFHSVELSSVEKTKEIEKVMLRFLNYTIGLERKGKTAIELFYDPRDFDEMKIPSKKCIGVYEKLLSINDELIRDEETGQSLSFDITQIKDYLFDEGVQSPIDKKRSISFGLNVKLQENEKFQWDKVELNIFVRES